MEASPAPEPAAEDPMAALAGSPFVVRGPGLCPLPRPCRSIGPTNPALFPSLDCLTLECHSYVHRSP